MKIKVWIPFEVEVSKPEIKKAMKRVRERWTLEPSDPVHMEDVINNLRDTGAVTLPIDDDEAGLKFDSEWEGSFMENDL